MKLKLFFIVLLALLASGCADSIVAVPKAVLTGTGNVITAVGYINILGLNSFNLVF